MKNTDSSFTSALGVFRAGHEDGGEFVGFMAEIGRSLLGHDVAFADQSNPVRRFLQFLQGSLDLANELRIRPAPGSLSLMCPYGSTRP